MFDDEIITAADRLVFNLKQRAGWITTAESCTGGLIGGAITAVAGASDCYATGFITYSNQAKTERLGVKAITLENYGAVSEETALEMAFGARNAAKATVSLSVTGIAGPGGGSAEKPVGLVYIGIAANDCSAVKRLYFGDIGRDAVRRETVLAALRLGLETLLQSD